MVAAKILLEMYAKFQEKWIVDLLFQDLFDENNWLFSSRICGLLNLICLGSELNARLAKTDNSVGLMQGGRYESGLDNSPMYDGEFFNTEIGLMEMYDVGMSSLFVLEADSLMKLAKVIGRDSDAVMLEGRVEAMRKSIAHLWNDELGIFTNMFVNGTFYPRISPTSFYPLLAKAATDEQADGMMKNWLMSPKHFCISEHGDFEGNSDDCYWGMPSIEASDEAFPPLGYWRGFVWGPMNQITYWSLQAYDHVESVRTGRKAMCKQMTSLMMSQWNRNRMICENYNPHRNATSCSGNTYYSWGALNGLISLEEAGIF